MLRKTCDTDAWRALSPTAQSLYIAIKLEWRGGDYDNNGEIRLSVRQAAGFMGCSKNSAAKAFYDLQAKGFIVQTKGAKLGVSGNGKSACYEITELSLTNKAIGQKLYLEWKPDNEFPVKKSAIHNALGKNGKRQDQNAKVTPHKARSK